MIKAKQIANAFMLIDRRQEKTKGLFIREIKQAFLNNGLKYEIQPDWCRERLTRIAVEELNESGTITKSAIVMLQWYAFDYTSGSMVKVKKIDGFNKAEMDKIKSILSEFLKSETDQVDEEED